MVSCLTQSQTAAAQQTAQEETCGKKSSMGARTVKGAHRHRGTQVSNVLHKAVHLFFTPLKRPFKRTLSPHAAGCLLVALGPLGRARRMSKKDEDGDEHEHAKVGLRELDEGTSKLSSQGSAVPGGRP